MKKLLSIILVIMLTMSLSIVASAEQAVVPISAELSAYELYLAAEEKMSGKSLEILGALEMTVSLSEDIIVETTASFTSKMRYNNEGEIEMATVGAMEALGEQFKFEQYFKDGFLYQNVMDVKMKSEIPALAASRGLVPESQIPGEFFSDATVEEVQGGKRIRITLGGDYMEKLVMDSVDIASLGGLDNVRFGRTTMWITIGDDGAMKEMAMVYRLSMEVEGVTMRIRAATNMHIVSVGKVQSISFPWDLNSYELVEI